LFFPVCTDHRKSQKSWAIRYQKMKKPFRLSFVQRMVGVLLIFGGGNQWHVWTGFTHIFQTWRLWKIGVQCVNNVSCIWHLVSTVIKIIWTVCWRPWNNFIKWTCCWKFDNAHRNANIGFVYFFHCLWVRFVNCLTEQLLVWLNCSLLLWMLQIICHIIFMVLVSFNSLLFWFLLQIPALSEDEFFTTEWELNVARQKVSAFWFCWLSLFRCKRFKVTEML